MLNPSNAVPGPGKPLATILRLLSQFFKSPRSIGTVAPSSRALAEAMLEPVDFRKISAIVELGPGTGPITTVIAERLAGNAHYIGIELNRDLYEHLKAHFPQLRFVNKSATDLENILRSFDVDYADAIISGLPWASLPTAVQPVILDAIIRSLRPGGVFVTFAYPTGMIFPAAWVFRRQLKARFFSVQTSRIVWNNFPPAFAYICRR